MQLFLEIGSIFDAIQHTGRLETHFVCAAHEVGLPVVVCNAGQVRQFARSTGRLAKTDRLDAQDIAHFGEALHPALTLLKPEKLREISDLITVRAQAMSGYEHHAKESSAAHAKKRTAIDSTNPESNSEVNRAHRSEARQIG